MKEDIIKIIIKNINENSENKEAIELNIETDLMELGMDSITFIKIVVAIEETFEIEVPDEKLLITEMNTASKIIEVVSFALKNNGE